jgi:glucose-6-phosphate 1-epimerase
VLAVVRQPAAQPAERAGHVPGRTGTAHGLARRDWQLLGIEEVGDSLRSNSPCPKPRATAGLAASGRAEAVVELGDQLQLTLTSHNLGNTNVTISQALHSYFAVSDVRQVQVEGVDGLGYIETLATGNSASSRATGVHRRDRPHLPERPNAEHRRPALEPAHHPASSGSRSAVIWNPWTERAGAGGHGRRWLAAHAVHRDGECVG